MTPFSDCTQTDARIQKPGSDARTEKASNVMPEHPLAAPGSGCHDNKDSIARQTAMLARCGVIPNVSLSGDHSARFLANMRRPVSFIGRFNVDCDGSPDAPYIDPYGDKKTSLQYSDGHYVDAKRIPYVALPSGMDKMLGVKLGDMFVVTNKENGRQAVAVFADVGTPWHKKGEGSMELARELGMNTNPNSGGTSRNVIEYTAFPGSGQRHPQSEAHLMAQLNEFRNNLVSGMPHYPQAAPVADLYHPPAGDRAMPSHQPHYADYNAYNQPSRNPYEAAREQYLMGMFQQLLNFTYSQNPAAPMLWQLIGDVLRGSRHHPGPGELYHPGIFSRQMPHNFPPQQFGYFQSPYQQPHAEYHPHHRHRHRHHTEQLPEQAQIQQPMDMMTAHAGNSQFANALVHNAKEVAWKMNSTGSCEKGLRLALEATGVHVRAPNAWSLRHQIASSDKFVQIHPSEAKEGDIGFRRWAGDPNHGGHCFTVVAKDFRGHIIEASDHITRFQPNNPRYDITEFYRPMMA